MQKKIVVLGGSFNPPTVAHLKLMLGAVGELDAHRGIFVPSSHDYVYAKMNRQKRKKEVFSEQERLDMLKAMCGANERLTVETFEYGKSRKGRTYETLEHIQEEYPGAEVYFLLGADKLDVVSRWHRSREFLDRFKILAVKRGDFEPDSMILNNAFLGGKQDVFSFMEMPEGIEGISSSKVRELIRTKDEAVLEYLHPAVWQIIIKRGWASGLFRQEEIK